MERFPASQQSIVHDGSRGSRIELRLVQQAMRGSHEAFGMLASRSIDRLYGAALLMLGDHDRAEEATQATLVRAWREVPRLRKPERFSPWLHRILLNTCRDQMRRSAREVPLVASDTSASPDHAEHVILRDEIGRGLRRLTVDQRSILVLRYFADLSVPEVASALGIPLGTAKSRLSRAVDALRAAVAAESRTGRGPEERS